MSGNIERAITDLADKLESKETAAIKSLIGFDGFVDEIVHVVKKRIDKSRYERELTLRDYGERIANTSGLSSSVEIVTVSKKLGGNGPILANALRELGTRMSYVGALGYPDVNPVFCDLTERCDSVYSVCDPSMTDAVEFDDGKIIRTKLSAFDELTFDMIKERVGLGVVAGLMDESTLIGFVNWALPPHSGEIWKGVLEEVLPLLKNSTRGKILFFDIADPYVRNEDDVRDVLQTIGRFTEHYNVVLGLNMREAVQIANMFGGSFDYKEENLRDIALHVREHVKAKTLVIHPVKESCCVTDDGYFNWDGPYCAKPKLTTGAGDNFNAGFIVGLSLGMAPKDALLIGMAGSGFYVRNARSANFEELKQFMRLWAKGQLDR